MTATLRSAEIAAYRGAVERRLADLSAAVREDLLADLETHLAEVADDLEPGMSLTDRLGTPEDYARELREAVDPAADEDSPAPKRSARFRAALARGLDRITDSAGAGTFAEFRQSLKPAWWIVRGVAAAGLIAWLVLRIDEHFTWAVLERWGWAVAAITALALPLAWYSVRVGNRSERWRPGARTALALAGVAMVGFTAVRAADVAFGNAFFFYDGSGYSPYASVDDVYPYTVDGELLTGVYLLDQTGNPLYLGDPSQCSVLTDNMYDIPGSGGGHYGDAPEAWDYGYRYPLCAPAETEGGTPTEAETTPAD